MKQPKKKQYDINGWTAYDEEGNVVQTYWQKDPIVVRMAPPFKLPWTKKFNPIYRLQQWWLIRRGTMVYGSGGTTQDGRATIQN